MGRDAADAAADRAVYLGRVRPAAAAGAPGSGLAVATTAKRLQSGRLDAYLPYMLIALVAVIAVVTALA